MTLALILSPGPTRLPDSAQGPKDRETESIKGKEWGFPLSGRFWHGYIVAVRNNHFITVCSDGRTGTSTVIQKVRQSQSGLWPWDVQGLITLL